MDGIPLRTQWACRDNRREPSRSDGTISTVTPTEGHVNSHLSVAELTHLLNSRSQGDGGKDKEGDPLREAGRATARDFAGFVVYFRHCRDC